MLILIYEKKYHKKDQCVCRISHNFEMRISKGDDTFPNFTTCDTTLQI